MCYKALQCTDSGRNNTSVLSIDPLIITQRGGYEGTACYEIDYTANTAVVGGKLLLFFLNNKVAVKLAGCSDNSPTFFLQLPRSSFQATGPV